MGFVIAQSSDAESAIKICTDALALITTNYL